MRKQEGSEGGEAGVLGRSQGPERRCELCQEAPEGNGKPPQGFMQGCDKARTVTTLEANSGGKKPGNREKIRGGANPAFALPSAVLEGSFLSDPHTTGA